VEEGNRLATRSGELFAEKHLLEALSYLSQARAKKVTPRVRAASLLFEEPLITFAARLPHPGVPITTVDFSADSRRVAVGSQLGLDLWTLGDSGRRRYPFEQGVASVRFVGPDLMLLASGSENGELNLERIRTDGDLEGRTLASYDGRPVGISRSGRFFLVYRPQKGAIIVGALSKEGGMSWSSPMRLYGRAGAPPGADWQTLLGAPEVIPAAAVAFREVAGEEEAALAGQIADADSGAWNNPRAVAWIDLSPPFFGHTWMSGHSAGTAVAAVAFSPDGRTMLTGSDDRQVRFWAAQPRGYQTMQFGLDHGQPVTALAVHPSGMAFASGGPDNMIRLWTWDRNLSQVIQGHSSPVRMLKFSPDGNYLLSVSDAELYMWQIGKAMLPSSDRFYGQLTGCPAFAEAGELVSLVDSERRLRVFRTRDLLPVGILDGQEIRRALDAAGDSMSIISPSACAGSRVDPLIHFGTPGGAIITWDIRKGRVSVPYPRGPGPVRSIALCEDEACLCAAYSKSIRVFERGTKVLDQEIPGPHDPTLLELSDGCRFAVFSSDEENKLLDIAKGTTMVLSTAQPAVGPGKGGLARFSAHGTRLALVDDQGSITTFRLPSGRRLARLETGIPGRISSLAFASDNLLIAGTTAAVTGGGQPEVVAWDVETGEVLERYPLPVRESTVAELEADPAGQRLLVLSGDLTIAYQGGTMNARILGSRLLYAPARARAALSAGDSTAPGPERLSADPPLADLWRAFWDSKTKADIYRFGNTALRGLLPFDHTTALASLHRWLTEHPNHPYYFEVNNHFLVLERRVMSVAPQ